MPLVGDIALAVELGGKESAKLVIAHSEVTERDRGHGESTTTLPTIPTAAVFE